MDSHILANHWDLNLVVKFRLLMQTPVKRSLPGLPNSKSSICPYIPSYPPPYHLPPAFAFLQSERLPYPPQTEERTAKKKTCGIYIMVHCWVDSPYWKALGILCSSSSTRWVSKSGRPWYMCFKLSNSSQIPWLIMKPSSAWSLSMMSEIKLEAAESEGPWEKCYGQYL